MAKKKRHKAKKRARSTGAERKRTTKKATKSVGRTAARKKAPAGLGIRNLHMDFLTYKPEQVRKFYAEMLELKTQVRDTEGLSYLVVGTSSTSSLGFMPPHPEMRREQPFPREPAIYFLVEDVDRAYRALSAKGVGFLGPPEEMPWGDRVITTTDPEGRTVILASTDREKK
ncbi:MAG TPA: VOC family protein [Vicinamibacteria bacterium]|nr:VOC family protein [Vicinamibacteria bacterium]